MVETSFLSQDKLAREQIDPDALVVLDQFYPQIVASVRQAIASEMIVVVGMAGNPFVKKARIALHSANFEFRYLEFGGYFRQWKQRLAIKLWSGWPTFPQVFVDGKLIGGFEQLHRKIENGSLRAMLERLRSP